MLEPNSFKLVQRLYSLFSQYMQFKHGIIGETATREPAFIIIEDGVSLVLATGFCIEISSLVVAHISCPRIIGGVTFLCPCLKTLTSYPHSAQALTSVQLPLSLTR